MSSKVWHKDLPISETIRKCTLRDGSVVKYDACGHDKYYYNPEKYKCIGQGRMHSIGGVLQSDNEELYFFVHV